MNTNTEQSVVGRVLLLHVLFVILILTLHPFQIRIPATYYFRLSADPFDIVRNVIFFIPLGFFFGLSDLTPRQGSALYALFAGASFSLVIETGQLFIPDRYPSLADVLSNGLGAWAGSVLYVAIKKRTAARGVLNVIALNLPLAGLVYLVTPLLMVNALSTGTDSYRIWLMVFPAVIGSLVLVSIYANRIDIQKAVSLPGVALFACGWFLITSLHAFTYYPVQVGSIALFLGVSTWGLTRRASIFHAPERRFEYPTIKRVIPVLCVYLVVLNTLASEIAFSGWSWSVGLNQYPHSHSLIYKSSATMNVIRFVEFTMSFVLLGYIAGEVQGRRVRSFGRAFSIVIGISFFTALICEVIRGFHAYLDFSLVEWFAATAAGGYGGGMYFIILRGISRPRPDAAA